MIIPSSIKLTQIGDWYIRLDLTILSKRNVLIGCNTSEGVYAACIDTTMTDCATFTFSEFQIGFLFMTFAIGKEKMIQEYGTAEDIEVQQDLHDGTDSGEPAQGDKGEDS